MPSFSVGSIQVQVLYDGLLREDPHDFFVDRPTAEWQAEAGVGPAGIERLDVQCLLVRAGGRYALLDTGLGLDERSGATEWVLGERGRLMPELANLGVAPEQIEAVILSHGHTDHLGGNVDLSGRPAFPNARYYLGAEDYPHFTLEGSKAASPFHVSQLEPLRAGDRLVLTEGEQEILPGVRLLPAPGHTPGHLCVGLASGGELGLYVGDLLHHPIQADHPDWSPLFDWMPAMAAESRQRLLDRARAERSLVFTAHFPFPGVGRMGQGWSAGG